MSISEKPRLSKQEDGMVAIFVTMVLMTVISLITIGFVRVTLIEQRQVTDRQLSSQAQYAAESGIELALKEIAGGQGEKTECGAEDNVTPADLVIREDRDIRITCLLIQPGVPNLSYQNVSRNGQVAKLKAETGVINTIYVAWTNTNTAATGDCGTTAGALPPNSTDWNCKHPLLRVDIVPLCQASQPNCLSQSTLQNKQFTSFLYPVTSGSKPTAMQYNDATGGSLGLIKPITCNTNPFQTDTSTCIAAISTNAIGLPAGYGNESFAVRLQSLYGNSDVLLYASTGAPGSASNVTLIDEQVLIDSTAQAVDVVKRIQVRKSVHGKIEGNDAAITSGGEGICKRYFVSDTTVSTSESAAACKPD